jgi:hypothetical protein
MITQLIGGLEPDLRRLLGVRVERREPLDEFQRGVTRLEGVKVLPQDRPEPFAGAVIGHGCAFMTPSAQPSRPDQPRAL